MRWTRRGFLGVATLGLGAGLVQAQNENRAQNDGAQRRRNGDGAVGGPAPQEFESWQEVRELFALDPDYIHMAGMLIASHPQPVAAAMERHRRELDRNPGLYLIGRNNRMEQQIRRAAAQYLGGEPEQYALTDSTTMGLGLIYNGITIRPDQEMLTTEHDYHATHHALRFKSERSGADVRRISLYDHAPEASADEMVERLRQAIRPQTRLLTLTYVHSSTGMKLPVKAMGQVVQEANEGRNDDERLIWGLDAVHALGVENFDVTEIGCDFLMAGTHKWLFGPRGTGIIWGHPRAHDQVIPIIPTFSRGDGWGAQMTPGGFHSFEHRWALMEAFQLHMQMGKAQVQARTHALADALIEGLAAMNHVRLHTPKSRDLHAGIVCFEVQGSTPAQVVRRLRQQNIVASTTPYDPSYARLSPAVFNTDQEIERTLAVIRRMG